jgi:hypothetical protein
MQPLAGCRQRKEGKPLGKKGHTAASVHAFADCWEGFFFKYYFLMDVELLGGGPLAAVPIHMY